MFSKVQCRFLPTTNDIFAPNIAESREFTLSEIGGNKSKLSKITILYSNYWKKLCSSKCNNFYFCKKYDKICARRMKIIALFEAGISKQFPHSLSFGNIRRWCM